VIVGLPDQRSVEPARAFARLVTGNEEHDAARRIERSKNRYAGSVTITRTTAIA
jgi:hypothetical protein